MSKAAGMVDAGLIANGHVSGSHQLGRILPEVVSFSILGHRRCKSCTLW